MQEMKLLVMRIPGDWGLQMGLIITELKERKPDLVYFDHEYTGEYPKEAPFTISELEEIYPCASGKAKVDEEFAKRAHDATVMLQNQGSRLHCDLESHFEGFYRRSSEELQQAGRPF